MLMNAPAAAHYQDPFRLEVAQKLHKALETWASASGLELPTREDDILRSLSVPPQFELGQAALPCFAFAKLLKIAPAQIAQKLKEMVEASEPFYIERIDAIQGYLNFHMRFAAYAESLKTASKHNVLFGMPLLPEDQCEKVVVEFAQPNTHKAMHVGHLRHIVLGDAVSNLLDCAGHKAVRVSFPGDMGAHVAKILWYILNRHKGPRPEAGVLERADWLGELYVKADEAVKTDMGTPKEAENRAAIGEILKSLHDEKGEAYELWKETREWSFEYMRSVYRWLRIGFDRWYTESECDKPSIALVKQKWKEGFFKEDDGAVGIDLSQWKLGFAMFLKRDGNGLYITKDLELIRRKFEDPAVTRSVYVVDARQKLHFQQLFKTAELMGYPQAARSVHLSYETVNTPEGQAFSSRALNGLKLLDLRKDMEEKVTKDYLERYRNIWTDEEIAHTAEIVTLGALKYGMLKVDNNTQIHFVRDEWLRLDGDTGPYLQYVHARCYSVLEKMGKPASAVFLELEDLNLQEQELILSLGRYSEFALKAAQEMRPSIIAGFLFDLGKAFNRFYENCPIRDASEKVKQARLELVSLTAQTMKRGLALLGIEAPQKM
jgi:arginyl-tRNA synthetase